MKILLIPEFGSFGGTRTFFRSLLEYYDRIGVELVVLLEDSQATSEIVEFIEHRSVKWYRLPSRPTVLRRLLYRFPFNVLFDLWAVAEHVRRQQPDLIVVSNGTLPNYLGLACLKPSFLYILHTYPVTPLNRGFRALLQWKLGPSKRLMTVSRFARSQIIHHWFDHGDVPWVEAVSGTPGPSFSPVSLGAAHPPTVLTLGHVEAYKNPLGWIDVAKQVLGQTDQPVEFVWAGEGRLLEACRERVDMLGLADRVRFIGYQAAVDALYERCSVYFQPSLMESQGLSVLDAMRRGIPCVVSDAGGLPESVEHEVSGYVVAVDSLSAMAAALVSLIENPHLHSKMGEAAQERFQACFSPRLWEHRLHALHESLGR